MSKFEQLTPAFRSEAIEEYRDSVRSQEISEAEITAQKLADFVEVITEADKDEEQAYWIKQNLGPDSTPPYHTDGDISLHVGIRVAPNSPYREPHLLIDGKFSGDNQASSKIFPIYKVTAKGELFRANPDSPDDLTPDHKAYWKKVSLEAQKDTRRVDEVKQMLESVAVNGNSAIRNERTGITDKLSSTKHALEKLVASEMADDVNAFRELDQLLQEAVRVKQARANNPADSLILQRVRSAITKELERYGIDFNDEDQLQGMGEATNQTLETYGQTRQDIRSLEGTLEATHDTSRNMFALNIQGIGK
jgi:hypothetical protein